MNMANRLKLLLLPAILAATAAQAAFIDPRAVDPSVKDLYYKALHRLPAVMMVSLPEGLEIKPARLSPKLKTLPDLCSTGIRLAQFSPGDPVKNPSIEVNELLLKALSDGRDMKMNCLHGDLRDEAVGSLLHELAHAYESNNDFPVSRDPRFQRIAGFKPGWLGAKLKNIKAQHSANMWEYHNTQEYFAVNLEYFLLDDKYACRRPVEFAYLSERFMMDPFPARNCKVNTSVPVAVGPIMVLKQLDPARIYRVDYLLASPGNDMASGFGHSMIRLVVCAPEYTDPLSGKLIPGTPYGPECIKDTLHHVVISYRADIRDGNMNYLKGISGGYPSMLFLISYVDIIDEYAAAQLRDLKLYPLALSETEKTEFVYKMLEEYWNYQGSYKFFTNNCAVETEDLVKSSVSSRDVLPNGNSVSPVGVFGDLQKLDLLDPGNPDREVVSSKAPLLVPVLETITGINGGKKALLKYMQKSRAQDRLASFRKIDQKPTGSIARAYDLMQLLGDYSILELYLLKFKNLRLEKKLFGKLRDEEQRVEIHDLIFGRSVPVRGYGILLEEDLQNPAEDAERQKKLVAKMKEITDRFKKEFADDFKEVDQAAENVIVFTNGRQTQHALFRRYLREYVEQGLREWFTAEPAAKSEIVTALGSGDPTIIGDTARKIRSKYDAKYVRPIYYSDRMLIESVKTVVGSMP
jgi:hypothetical protein